MLTLKNNADQFKPWTCCIGLLLHYQPISPKI